MYDEEPTVWQHIGAWLQCLGIMCISLAIGAGIALLAIQIGKLFTP